ncbi:MAG: hypothetical protein HY290_21165 [Planctomycetia bacterium]|nr:hypothetical protein [Planctomycetia bacterium]
MTEEPRQGRTPRPEFRLLEQLTAGVLLLVLAALAWMTIAAYLPAAKDAVVSEPLVIGVIVLLLAALALVSIVALLHTRK